VPRDILFTPRLVLEPLAERHARPLFPLLADTRLWRYIPHPPAASPSALREDFRLRRLGDPAGRDAWLNWAVRVRRGGACAGRLEATVRPEGRAELAYLIGRRFQRLGYAREGCQKVLEWLFLNGVRGVTARMDRDNRASEGLVRALGFRRARGKGRELRYELWRSARILHEWAGAHDRRGEEREAIPLYEQAIHEGLRGKELAGACLGLGSSYRCVGEAGRAVATLRKAAARFPRDRALRPFLAMALHSVGEHGQAIGLLLRELAQTSADPGIQRYRSALVYYARELTQS